MVFSAAPQTLPGGKLKMSDENQRSVVADTETTGLEPSEGHKVIEIAAVEIVNLLPTGREFHYIINPGRPIPQETTDIHGITDDMVADKPRFSEIVDEFLDFLGDSPFIAHNADFDVRFLNAELAACRRPSLQNPVIDTIVLARRLGHAKANRTLDDFCRKFGIDRSARVKHGALIDSRLLAEVYHHLYGGPHRQMQLAGPAITQPQVRIQMAGNRLIRPARNLGLATAADAVKHAELLAGIKNAVWLEATPESEASMHP
jgi:DNA polymerase-3 subunit epsilon